MRAFATFRIALASSPLFATARAAVATLLLVPLCEVVLAFLLARVLGAPSEVVVALRAVLVGGCASAASTFVMTLVVARDDGVLAEVLLRRPVDLQFFCGVGMLSFGSAGVSAALTLVLTLFATGSWGLAGACFASLPVALLLGVGLGVVCGVWVLVGVDPFVALNLVVPVLPLAVGVLVPLTVLPLPGAAVFGWLPLASTLHFLDAPARLAVALAVDGVSSVVVLVLGLGVLLVVNVRLTRSGRFSWLWSR